MRRALISLGLFFAFAAIYTLSRHALVSTTTTTTSTSTTSTTSTTTTLAHTTCSASDFSGVYNEGEGAAGTVYASVTLTKTTAGSCTLEGWPRLTLVDRLGAVLPAPATDVPSAGTSFQFLNPPANAAPKSIRLAMNGTVNFAIAYSDVPTGTEACESAVTVSVQFIAGGAAIPVTPQYAVQPCDGGRLWVSPYY